MDSLKLTYPSVQSGQEFLIDSNPKAIKTSLQKISYVNIDKALNSLSLIVSTLNRCPLKLSHIEENSYLISNSYLVISRHMREQHDRHKTLVNNQQYNALHTLSTEVAFLFKRSIEALSKQKFLLNKNKRLAKALNYGQHHLGIMLIEQYQLYSPIPAYIWRELHQIYRYAEAHNLLDIPISSDELNPLEPTNTVKNSYLRNCLMAVINPYHIEDNLHWHLFKYLGHWSEYTEISSDTKNYQNDKCFVIELGSDSKPHFINENRSYEDEHSIRLLLTQGLLNKVKEHLKDYHSNHQLPKLGFYTGIEPTNGKKLLERVYNFCDTIIKREDTRYPVITSVDTIWGLTNIHKVLSKPQHFEQAANLTEAIEQNLNKYPYQVRWQAVNYSEGGICIKNMQQAIKELRVGNLVLLKRHINGIAQKNWQVAITRWLNGSKGYGATSGLEFIHGEPRLISYITKDNNGNFIDHQVLMIKPYDSSERLLITAKNLIGEQRNINIKIDDKEILASLSNVIETNVKLSIFYIRF